MQQTAVTTAVWQRRTNKIIAAGITIIGLTMMLSLIPQCIYIGIVFVTCSLIWLGWMTIKEKQQQQQQQQLGEGLRADGQHPTSSPVLFLVASHHLRQTPRGPTLPDPNDKPPTYDQVLTLDGLPPDYYSVLTEKPPRYEDVGGGLGWGASALPVELYSTDLTCVHTPTAATLHHHHHQTDITTQPSVFLQETAASWAGLGDHHHHQHQPEYTAAAHNPAFASDDPAAVIPLVMETKDFPPPSPATTSLPPFQDTLQDRRDHHQQNDYSISPLDKK